MTVLGIRNSRVEVTPGFTQEEYERLRTQGGRGFRTGQPIRGQCRRERGKRGCGEARPPGRLSRSTKSRAIAGLKLCVLFSVLVLPVFLTGCGRHKQARVN